MSNSIDGGEFYPGQNLPLSQLLHAAGKKLQDAIAGGRIVATLNQKEVDALEQDASEVFLVARSIKNTSAPINRIPPDVLSLIPDYCETNEDLVTLTHVCRSWRETSISRASLWTFLDCTNLDQTNVYLQRSKGSPLNIHLMAYRCNCICRNALLLTLPHIGRLKTLAVFGSLCVRKLNTRFNSPAPLLEELRIKVHRDRLPSVESTVFGGNLSSLRELHLYGVLTDLPWRNLANLTAFDFRRVPGNKISVTQLLDFFEDAPRLREIKLRDSLPYSSNAPSERVVSLPHLRLLRIDAQPVHPILLNHLEIPTGAFITLDFKLSGERSQILDYLPRSIDNLNNISRITSVNLDFRSGVTIWFSGSNGDLYVSGGWVFRRPIPPILEHEILPSLDKFHISTTESLAIAHYGGLAHTKIEESDAYQTLFLMKNLRILTLTYCADLSFIFALNPDRNTSNAVICPRLGELVLYIQEPGEESCVDELLEMAKGRASKGVKLSTVMILCPRDLIPAEKVLELRKYVSYVDYRLVNAASTWVNLLRQLNHHGYDIYW